MLIDLARAKDQLGIDQADDFEDTRITRLINQAIGLVCSDIGRLIYQTAAEVPEGTEAPIILDELQPYQLANLETACLLQISSLDSNREVEIANSMAKNPAYTTAIKQFKRVLIG